MTKPAIRLRGRTEDRRRDFSAQHEELSQSGQRTSSTQDGNRWVDGGLRESVAHLLTNECNICKAERVILAKCAPTHQITCADLMLGQAEEQPDGRQHKTELFSIANMSLIIT